jgi:hypothetical protein
MHVIQPLSGTERNLCRFTARCRWQRGLFLRGSMLQSMPVTSARSGDLEVRADSDQFGVGITEF